MARPRKISDADLLSACERAVGRYGPGFKLTQVATEAGVSVGTVAGRFGSKHALLVAMMNDGTTRMQEKIELVAAEHDDPIEALRAALLVMAEGVGDPETASQHLAQLGVDLADPQLRCQFAVQRRAMCAVLSRLVAAAELPFAPPPEQAAGVLAALVNGLQLDWALSPNGKLQDRLSADVGSVLTAWRGAGAARRPT